MAKTRREIVPKADIAELGSRLVVLERRKGTGVTRPVPFCFGLPAMVAGFYRSTAACWKCVSAHVSCALLLLKIIGTLRLCRQLKHRRLLSLS